jgi:AcrR family transcriptional regulator
MLEVVAERGFHDAPMSLIAERAGASAGVIYHHFASKEEIIQALYRRLSELKRRQILEGYTPAMDPRDAFVQIALNAYRFYRQHQRELRFLEQFELAGFPCPPPTLKQQEQISDFERKKSRNPPSRNWRRKSGKSSAPRTSEKTKTRDLLERTFGRLM